MSWEFWEREGQRQELSTDSLDDIVLESTFKGTNLQLWRTPRTDISYVLKNAWAL